MNEGSSILSTPASLVDATPPPKVSPLAVLGQLSATILSAACPGSGHFLLGESSKGMLLSGLFAALLCAFWPLRLPRYYPGFVILIAALVVLGLYSACSAQWIPNAKSGYRVSAWWLAITLPAALVIISFTGTGIVRAAGFRIFDVPSVSMEPTIQRGDRILVDVRAFHSHAPQYRDVIVSYRKREFTVKRIIAIGGDSIEGRSGQVMLNGSLINESYIQHSLTRRNVDSEDGIDQWMQTFGPVTVPTEKYFVMGDNRDVSLDSRSPEYGFVEKGSIMGKVLFVYKAAHEGAAVR
ncbi:MAG TPA: signal peptidase I [Candidatus Sulfotelmatobacter sp.]